MFNFNIWTEKSEIFSPDKDPKWSETSFQESLKLQFKGFNLHTVDR